MVTVTGDALWYTVAFCVGVINGTPAWLNANWNNLRACLKTVIYSNIRIVFTPTVDKKNFFDFFFWLITKCNNIWLC